MFFTRDRSFDCGFEAIFGTKIGRGIGVGRVAILEARRRTRRLPARPTFLLFLPATQKLNGDMRSFLHDHTAYDATN